MARIHHATLAKAKKFNITLTIEDNDVVATAKNGARLASGLQGNKVLEEAITKLTGKVAKGSVATETKKPRRAKKVVEETDDQEDGEALDEASEQEVADDEEGAAQPRSVVKAKYKKAYQPHKAKNGDDLGKQVSAHVSREDDETGEMRIELSALKRFAKANECWVEGYSSLRNKSGTWNAGMARMNVCNRLRAILRKDADYVIQWV